MIKRKLMNQSLCILLGGMMAIGGAGLPVLAGECDAGSTVIAADEAQAEDTGENAAEEQEEIGTIEESEAVEERQEQEAGFSEMDNFAEEKTAAKQEDTVNPDISGSEQADSGVEQDNEPEETQTETGVEDLNAAKQEKTLPTFINIKEIYAHVGDKPVRLTIATKECGKKYLDYGSKSSHIASVTKDGVVSFLSPGKTFIGTTFLGTDTLKDAYANTWVYVKYTGFYRREGKLYYYKDDYNPLKGWNKINGYTYYMAQNGAIRNGWQTIGGKKYYFWTKTEKGHYSNTMATGWCNVDGKKYFFGSNGVMRTGWNTINGYKYYMGKDGVIRNGWQTIGGKKYYFWVKTEKGHYSNTMATSWSTVDGKKFYFGNDGVMRTGWNTINGYKYYMGGDGVIRTGWQTIGGKKYYFWPKTENGHYRGTLRK